MGRWNAHLNFSRQVLAIDRTRPFAYLLGIKALCGLDRYAEAQALAESGIAALPQDGRLRLARALILRDTGHPLEALRELEQAHELLPTDAEVVRQQALTYGSMEKMARAVQLLEEAIALEPENAETFFWLGYFLIHRKQYQKALRAAERMLALAPQATPARLIRGIALRGLRRYREAEADLARAQYENPVLYERLSNDPFVIALIGPARHTRFSERMRRSITQGWQALCHVLGARISDSEQKDGIMLYCSLLLLLKGENMNKSLKSLLLAGAAVAIPATVNAIIAYRAGQMTQPLPGDVAYYDWVYGRVAYYRMGQGMPLVLVHHPNAGSSSWEWRKVFPALANHYTVHAIDLLGFGLSDKPDVPYSGRMYADLLHDFLQDVIVEPADAIGSALGASYVVNAAVRRPESLRRLMLVNPTGCHGQSALPTWNTSPGPPCVRRCSVPLFITPWFPRISLERELQRACLFRSRPW